MNKYPSVEVANFLNNQNNPPDSQRDHGDKGLKKQKMLLSESLKNIQIQNENLEVDISDQKMMYTRQIREMDQESLSIKSQIDYTNLQINQQQILKKELQFKILSCKDKIQEYQESLQQKSNMQKQLTRSLSNGIKSTVKENENLKQMLLEKQQSLGSMENDLIEVQQKIQELQSEVELLISTSGLKSQMIQHCRQELQANFQKMEQSKMEINSLRDLLASCEMEHKSAQSQVQECKQQKSNEQELLQKQLSQIKIDQEQMQREKKAEQKKMVFIHKQSAIRVIFNSVNKIKRRFYLEFILKLQNNEQKSLQVRQKLRRVLVIQNKLYNKVMQFYLKQWRSKINLKQEENRNEIILQNIYHFKTKAKFYKMWRKCFEQRQFQLYRKYQALSSLNIIDKTLNKIVIQRAFSKWLAQIKKIYKFIFCLERVNRNIQNNLVRQGFNSIQQEYKKQLQENLFEENINFVVQQRIQFQCFQEWKNFQLTKKRKNIIILGRSLKLWKLFIYKKKMRQLQIFHISVNLKNKEEKFLKKIINSWNFTIQDEKIQKLREKQQQLNSQQENVSSSLRETEEELLNTQKRHALTLVINRQSSQLKSVIHQWRIASINVKNQGKAFCSILNEIIIKQKLQAFNTIKKQNEKYVKSMENKTITQFHEQITNDQTENLKEDIEQLALTLWKTNLKHNNNLVKLSSVLNKYFKVQLQRVYFNYLKQYSFNIDISQQQQKVQELEKNFNDFKRKHDSKVKEISEQLINLDQIQQNQNEKKLEIKNVLRQKNQWKIQIFQQDQGYLKMKQAYLGWKFLYNKNTKIINQFYKVLYANILRSSFYLIKDAYNQDKMQKRKQYLLQKILRKRKTCDMKTWISKWYILSQKKKEIQLCQKNSNQNFQNQIAHERRITTIQRFLSSQLILKNMKIQKQYLQNLKDYVRQSKINNNRIDQCRKNIEKKNIKTFIQALRQNNLLKKQIKQNEQLINQKNNFKKLSYYFFQLKFLLQRNKRFARIIINIISCNQILSQKYCFQSIKQASHGQNLKKIDFKNRGLTQLITSASQIMLKWLSSNFRNLKSFSYQQPYKKDLLKKLIQRKIQFVQRSYIQKWRFKSNQMKQFQEDSEEGDSKLEQVFLSKRFDIILEFIASKGYDMSQLNTYVKQKKQREIDLMHKSATRLILNASEMNLLPKSFNTWFAFVQRRKSIKEACQKMLPRIRQPDLVQAFKKWKSETFIVYSKTQFDTRDVLLEKMVVFKENTDRLERQLKEAENMLNEQTTLNTLLENKNVLAEKFAIRIISLFEKKVQKQGFDKWISFVKQQRQDEYEYIQLQSDDKVNELQLEIQRLNTLFMELQKQNEELRAISLESISVAESIQNIAKERDGTNDALKEKQISIQNLIEENNSLSVKLNLAQSQTAQIMRMSKLEKSQKNNFPQETSSTHTSYEQSL
ncbi:hypothetical protein ABPG74_021965 [Tetrahymena malaccensis]